MKHDLTIHLSRLEISYKLACHLVKSSISITSSTLIPINSSAGKQTRRLQLEALDDGSSDGSTDSDGFGNQLSPPEYDWGW